MASFKVRRPLLAMSGATISGTTTLSKLSTGSLAVTSGSTTIGASGMAVGTGGTKFTKLNFGSLTVTSPSFGALTTGSSLVVAHAPFPNVAAGDKVFVQAGSMGLNICITGASATAASTISVQWQTTGCTAVAENTLVTLQYLALTT